MKDYPVIKVAILFVAGILSAHFFEIGYVCPLILSFICHFIINSFLQKIWEQYLLLFTHFNIQRIFSLFDWK